MILCCQNIFTHIALSLCCKFMNICFMRKTTGYYRNDGCILDSSLVAKQSISRPTDFCPSLYFQV